MNVRRLRAMAITSALAAAAGLLLEAAAAQAQNSEGNQRPTPLNLPAWAYPVNLPGAPPPPPAHDDGSPRHLPNTSVALTLPQTRDAFNVPDWYPNEHPTMPEAVAHGRKPDVRACGYCHLPNGQGRPENAALAGLAPGYIAQQVADFRDGLRRSSEPRMGPPAAMIVVAKGASDAEVKAAADYFASIKFKPWIRVVETKMVPKSIPAGGMLVAARGGGEEPMGQRIIEMPEELERTELRDSASGFVAYVPVGSIKKGEALVTTGGGGKTIRCSLCHGKDLKGLGNVPPLAGRSPSYIVRQLFDIQSGVRNGPWTQLMKEVVAKLTVDDMVSIVAYTSSRTP